MEFVMNAMEPLRYLRVFGTGRIDFRYLVCQRFLLFLHGVQLVEDGHALVEYRSAGERQTILRQIAYGDALHLRNAAPVEPFQPGEDSQQRGLAASVGADKADALVGRDQPVQAFKQDFGAKSFRCACELNHCLQSNGQPKPSGQTYLYFYFNAISGEKV